MSQASIKLEGAEQLDALLGRLGRKEALKVAKKGTREGAKVIQAAAKANARSMIGGTMGKLISRFLTVRALTRGQRRRDEVGAGVIINKKGNDEFVDVSKSGKRNYIPNAIEFGHDNVAPRPYQRSAFDTKKLAALRRVIKVMWDGIRAVPGIKG